MPTTNPATNPAASVDPYLPTNPDAAKAYAVALALAQTCLNKGESARLEPADCETALALLTEDFKAHPEWATALAGRKFGTAELGALAASIVAYRKATDASPLDWREFEKLTPEQKARVPVIAKVLSAYKNAVTVKAKRTCGLDAVGVLGRGMSISSTSAPSVHAGLSKFITGAEVRTQLLAAAGITATDLQKLIGMRDELAAYPTVKGQRDHLKSTLADQVDLYGVLVEVLFDDLRVAASMAFAGDPTTHDKIFSRLPRAPERRSKPAVVKPAE